MVCSLKSLLVSPLSSSLLSLSLWVSHFISSCLSLSHRAPLPQFSPSPFSVTWSPCLRVSVSVSLSPRRLHFQLFLSLPAPLSVRLFLSWSICPSLSVCLCVGVSVHLFHHPSVWLSVVSEGAHSLPKVPSPRSAKASPGLGRGEGYRAAASGSFSSSWAELGVGAASCRSGPSPGLSGQGPLSRERRESRASPQLSLHMCVREEAGASLGQSFLKPGPQERGPSTTFFIP